jgi:Family of unknown function (DUF6271)
MPSLTNRLFRKTGLKAKYSSLVYLPTNRECTNAIHSYSAEVRWANEQNHSALLCVVESKDDHDAEINEEAVKRVRQSGTPAYQFSLQDQKLFLHSVFTVSSMHVDTQRTISKCLFPTDSCYSSNPNKASLLASLLGARTIHRRDSDTYLRSMSPDFFPIMREIENLADCPQKSQEKKAARTGNQRFAAVGTGYFGDESLDRRMFKKYAPDLLIEHERLNSPHADDAELRKKVAYKYYWPNKMDPRAVGLPELSEDIMGLSEMGCIAFDVAGGLLPELPLPNCLSTEHFHKNLLYRLNIPILYQNILVGHKSVARETIDDDLADYVNYALKDAAFKALRVIVSRMNEAIEGCIANTETSYSSILQFGFERYGSCILKAIESTQVDTVRDAILKTSEIYNRAATAAGQPKKISGAFLMAEEEIKKRADEISQRVFAGFEAYVVLANAWDELNTSARLLGRN